MRKGGGIHSLGQADELRVADRRGLLVFHSHTHLHCRLHGVVYKTLHILLVGLDDA